MNKSLINLIKVLVAVIAILCALVALRAAWKLFDPRYLQHDFYLPILICLAIGLVIGSRRSIRGFYRTLEHELTHVIFGVLCFRSPKHMLVTSERGGEAGFNGSVNWLISLCPYFFPLTAVVIALLSLITMSSIHIWMGRLIIIALGYHLAVIFSEIRIGQSDLQRHNSAFSGCFIAGIGIPLFALLMTYAAWDASGVRLWLHACRDTLRLVGI